jgi:hypothetical protein
MAVGEEQLAHPLMAPAPHPSRLERLAQQPRDGGAAGGEVVRKGEQQAGVAVDDLVDDPTDRTRDDRSRLPQNPAPRTELHQRDGKKPLTER